MNLNLFACHELIRKELQGTSDRAAAIVAGEFIDEILTEIFKAFLFPDSENDKNLFSWSG